MPTPEEIRRRKRNAAVGWGTSTALFGTEASTPRSPSVEEDIEPPAPSRPSPSPAPRTWGDLLSSKPKPAPAPAQPTPKTIPGALSEPEPNGFNWEKPKAIPDKMPEWREARENPQLLETIKRYAKNIEGKSFASDEEAFDWYVSDRRWVDATTQYTLRELNYAKGWFGSKYAKQEDLQDLAYLRSEWDKLPGGFARIGKGDFVGGADAILKNVARGFVDVTVFLGVAGRAGKAAGALATKALSGSAMSATKKATINKASQVGGAVLADASITGGLNAAYQETNVEAGIQDEVDGWEVIKAGAIGGLVSAPGAYMALTPTSARGKVDPKVALEQAKRTITERRTAGLPGLYGPDGTEGSLTLPDGRKLLLTDIELAQDPKALTMPTGAAPAASAATPETPIDVDFSNFSRALAKDVAKTRKAERDAAKAAGKAGGRSRLVPTIMEADQTAYDPLLDTLSVKSGAKLDDAAGTALRDLTKHDVDVAWRKETLNVTIEDGTTAKVAAGDVVDSLRKRTKQADDLITCLGT